MYDEKVDRYTSLTEMRSWFSFDYCHLKETFLKIPQEEIKLDCPTNIRYSEDRIIRILEKDGFKTIND